MQLKRKYAYRLLYHMPAVPSYTMKLKWLFTAGIRETYTNEITKPRTMFVV
jgi:hypothetical protein